LDQRYPAWVGGVQATELYQSMIAPVVPYPLRGFLWYQGEANVMNGDGANYQTKLAGLIDGWRRAWDSPDAPFYFALLAPFNYSEHTTFPRRQTPLALPRFWEAQVAVLAMPRTGLIVTSDLVDDVTDIHPPNKADVGRRFARLALADTYVRGSAMARSPRFAGVRSLGDGRLEVRFADTGGALRNRDGQPLRDWEIAGADRKFLPAQAVIDGDRVLLSNDEVPEPVAVRFGWHETARPNLVGRSHLPAVPFRTDDWPVATTVP
ncbi:MAG TPA: sialate O-acetylesterase, partial [Candidatus Synoicihabitans sp.]|nr:sialate O-acetylesterase [Candidatus Synoicihabitans sp.]